MSIEYVRPVSVDTKVFTSASKDLSTIDKEHCVRVYRTQSRAYKGGRWHLQLRGPRKTGFMIASASLGREDMEALRDALSAALAEP